MLRQLMRHNINPEPYVFKKIYRKARALDVERWQEAIAREHETMIRARQLAANLRLQMKIGDVEFQGDGTKAIFYYIADERVDFRQLIKDFAEEFRIRIAMKQIGARQEAGLIGGIGVCGRPLCCSQFMADFKSITTQAARCQDLSLNPQKLAGQCSKLKCCINYEASVYIDAQRSLPDLREPLEFEDGLAYLVKTDVLKKMMWFSFDKGNMANMFTISADDVREIKELNRKGIKGEEVIERTTPSNNKPEFVTAVGDDSISRFDDRGRGAHRSRASRGGDRRPNRGRHSNEERRPAEDRRSGEDRRAAEDRRPNEERRSTEENRPRNNHPRNDRSRNDHSRGDRGGRQGHQERRNQTDAPKPDNKS